MKLGGKERELGVVLMTGVVIFPWLLPPGGPPTPALQPWLFSLLSVALLLAAHSPNASTLPLWRQGAWVAGGAVLALQLRSPGWGALSTYMAIFMVMACAVMAAGRAARHPVAAALAATWLGAALLNSGIAICQYFGVEQHFPFMSLSSAGEVFGNLRQRNLFASLTSIGLASMYWWVVQAQKGSCGAKKRGGTLLMVGLLVVGNLLSSSRTGLLQLLVVVGMVSWWHKGGKDNVSRLFQGALLVYGVGTLILPWLGEYHHLSTGIASRLGNEALACNSRLTLWSNVLHLIAQRPWLGWGWGELAYAHFTTLYPGTRFCEILDNAHNLPLHLAVELGIPLAVLICGVGVRLILHAKPWQETDVDRRLAWCVLAVISIHSMLEYPLWYGPFQMTLGFCLGLLWAASPMNPKQLVENKAGRGLQIFLGAGVSVAAVYAGWDYHRISQIYLAPVQRTQAYGEISLDQVRNSWLYKNQVRFAEYTLTPLTHENADRLHALGEVLLHYSPEPRVVEKLIESAVLLERDENALFYLSRYKAAYPQDHARWLERQ